MALPNMQNPTDLRRAIMSRMNISPRKLAGFGGDMSFDNAIRALYRQATANYAAQDQSEQRYLGDYEKALANRVASEGKIRNSLRNAMAHRGSLRSGIYTTEAADLESDFANQRDQLNTEKVRNIEDINSRRQGILNDLLTQRGMSESNYYSDLSNFLNTQAQLEAKQEGVRRAALRPITPTVTPTVAPTVTPRPVIPQVPDRTIAMQTRVGPARKKIRERNYMV